MTVEQSPFSWLLKQGIDWISKGRLSKTSGRLRLPGLLSRVEVIRDRWGVPHIYAEKERDLFFAQGFVHAQDRLWQMEFQRRLVTGRLSEMVGEQALPVDRWMRVIGMACMAEEEVANLSSDGREILEAYAEGVNAFIRSRHFPVEFTLLRFEPERWQVADSLAWSRMMAWMLSGNWECELMRQQLIEKLGPDMTGQLVLQAEDSWPLVMALPNLLQLEQSLARMARPWVGPGAGEGVGSNNWVISGERTTTGKPILANDMHLLLTEPATWYENHLVCGDYQVTGVSLPGIPMIITGHNGQVAWGFTAGFADVQDLYEEHLRRTPEGGVEYEYQGGWHPAEVRQEEIRVRSAASRMEEVIITRHGPVINALLGEESGAPLALCWTARETSGGTFRALADMNKARNCQEFREALSTWNVPVLNVVYADTQGNIAYTLAGQVPIREQGEGRVPVPGWTGDHEWTSFIPREELPHIENPPTGYIATANNHVAGPDYPYYLGRDYMTGDRAERIAELILRQPLIDVRYTRAMQFDQVSPTAQVLARLAGNLSLDDDPQLAQAAAYLRGWDGHLAVSSPSAAIYEVFSRQLILVIFENRLGNLMPRFAGAMLSEVTGANVMAEQIRGWLRNELLRPQSHWFDLGSGETRDDVLRLALKRAVDFLTVELGLEMDNWTWGQLHQLTFHHVLGRQKPLDAVFNRGPYPIGGDSNTIWASASLLDRVDSSDGMVGPPFRFIADLSDLSQSVSVLVPGQSGQVGSPHYDDQVEAWFKGGYHPMLWRRQDVLQEQEACLELLP